MTGDNEFFTPEEVDEQIDAFSQGFAQQDGTNVDAARVSSHLRQLYARNSQQHTRVLERAWERIVEEHQLAKQTSQEKGPIISMQEYQGELQAPQELQTLNSNRVLRKRRVFVQWFSILAAVVFIGILVGSMLLVLHTAQQSKSNPSYVKNNTHNNTHTGSDGKPHPKPPHPITGGNAHLIQR